MKVLNENLMEKMLESENLRVAWMAVKSNKGSAGIDGIGIGLFIEHIRPHWSDLKVKILDGRYKPAAVKRVYIPKGNGKVRPLGIPTVQDRFLQQALLQILRPIFEPRFSEHSYGFRPGRSAHDAVKASQAFIKEDREWVVDIDMKSFFDEVNHDILMHRVSEVISDKQVLRFIGSYLRAGVLEDGKVTKSAKGVPQGGPLSPLLANIYLDALDKELEARGQTFCRYADDCNIYVGSHKAAERVFKSITAWIEKYLKIPINRDKSGSGRPWERQFLGYQPTKKGTLKPSAKSLEKFKSKVRHHFSGRMSLTSKELRNVWRRFVIGWSNYFSLANERTWRKRISGWTRRHVRKCFWLRWHCPKGRRRNMLKLGVSPKQLGRCDLHGAPWPMAKHPSVNTALNNRTLKLHGFLVPLDFAAR
jgi:RNA-directed DNA polymerase